MTLRAIRRPEQVQQTSEGYSMTSAPALAEIPVVKVVGSLASSASTMI